METVNLSRLYARAANYLHVDVSKIKVDGEDLRSELNLKYHKSYLVYKDTSSQSTPFPMKPINKITKAFRSTIVLHDLPRRCNKRNYTLTEDGEKFIFIVTNSIPSLKTWKDKDGAKVTNQEQIDEFIKNQQEERDWISRVLKPVTYSSVKQAEIAVESLSNYSWVEREEVEVPVREVYPNGRLASFRPTFLRSKGNFRGERCYEKDPDTGDHVAKYKDSPTFLYTVVARLEDVQDGTSTKIGVRMNIIEILTGMKPVLLSKSKKRYFEGSSHIEYTDELFDTLIKKKGNLDKLQSIVNAAEVDSLLDTRTYCNTKQYFPRFITKEFRVRKPRTAIHWADYIPEYVSGISKKSLVERWEEYFSSLKKQYPILRVCGLNSYGSLDTLVAAEVGKYIQTIIQKKREEKFSKLPYSKQEKIKKLQNKNKRKSRFKF